MNRIQRVIVGAVVIYLGTVCLYPIGFASPEVPDNPPEGPSIFLNSVPEFVGHEWIWNLEIIHQGYMALEITVVVGVAAALYWIWNDTE